MRCGCGYFFNLLKFSTVAYKVFPIYLGLHKTMNLPKENIASATYIHSTEVAKAINRKAGIRTIIPWRAIFVSLPAAARRK